MAASTVPYVEVTEVAREQVMKIEGATVEKRQHARKALRAHGGMRAETKNE